MPPPSKEELAREREHADELEAEAVRLTAQMAEQKLAEEREQQRRTSEEQERREHELALRQEREAREAREAADAGKRQQALEERRQTEERAREQFLVARQREQEEMMQREAGEREREDERARLAMEREARRQEKWQEELRMQEQARAERDAAERAELQARRQAEEAEAAERRLALQRQEEEQAARKRAEELALRQQELAVREAATRRQAAEAERTQRERLAAREQQGLEAFNPSAAALPRNLGGGLAARVLDQARNLANAAPMPQAMLVPSGAEDNARRRSVFGRVDQDVGLNMYVDAWRVKIERNGNLNYAQSSRERARGDPVVTVVIRSDGSVEDVIINRSSGRPELDEAVRRIVRVNARYSRFPPELARRYDVIEIRRIWNFDDTLRIVEDLR